MIALGSIIPAPRAGLGSVDRFVEVAELEPDPELVSRSDCTAGCDGTSFANVMPSAGGGLVAWFCGGPRPCTVGGGLGAGTAGVVAGWVPPRTAVSPF